MIASGYSLDRAACQKLGIRDAYGVHKAVYSLFPPREGGTRDFLYADKGGDERGRTILILSARPPKEPELGTITIKEIPERFLEHDVYGFEVTLNRPSGCQDRKNGGGGWQEACRVVARKRRNGGFPWTRACWKFGMRACALRQDGPLARTTQRRSWASYR
jgi:CRISPR-associated protein Cas6/Cse3/CasE subtype I-E